MVDSERANLISNSYFISEVQIDGLVQHYPKCLYKV